MWRYACVCQYASLPLEELLSVVEKDLAAVTNAKVTPKVGDTDHHDKGGHRPQGTREGPGCSNMASCSCVYRLGFGLFKCMLLM